MAGRADRVPDEVARERVGTPRGEEPVPPAAAALLALQRSAGNAAVAQLMRMSKPQEARLREWERKLSDAGDRLDTKPNSLFTDKFRTDHARVTKNDDLPQDFRQRSSATATRRFEGRAEAQHEAGGEREDRAGTSSLIHFGPTALANMLADVKAWANRRGGIHTTMKGFVQAGQGGAPGAWRRIGAGGAPCEEHTDNQFDVLTTEVLNRVDRQGDVQHVRLKIGPSVEMLEDGRLQLRVHHYGGPAD
jgi:hypothetical protein